MIRGYAYHKEGVTINVRGFSKGQLMSEKPGYNLEDLKMSGLSYRKNKHVERVLRWFSETTTVLADLISI
jgi:hypothetical protein